MAAPGRNMLIPLGQILQRHISDPATVRRIMRVAATATDTMDFIREAMQMGREAADVANDVQHWIQQTESTWTEFRTQVANQVASWTPARSGTEDWGGIGITDSLDDIIEEANRNNPFNTGQGQLNSGATPVRDVGTGGRSRIHQNDPMDASGQVEPVAEAAARSGGGGAGNPVSKETPISNYPSLSYGLQETHTTILPYVAWMTLKLSKTDLVAQKLEIRLNTVWDMLNTTITAPPGAGVAFGTPGFYSVKMSPEGVQPYSSQPYPTTLATGTTATERPQWRDYWSQLYGYYTVLGCEYEIIHVNPIVHSNMVDSNEVARKWGGEIIIAEQVDSYSDTATSTGNVMPTTTLDEAMNYKNIKWHKLGASGLGNGMNTTIVRGTYKPGQVKRNIINDGDVKTWTATGSGLPNLKETLTLHYWKHPLSGGNLFGANIQIRLKYIVQFKDLTLQARYPNTVNGTGNVTQQIDNTGADDVRMAI